MAPILPILSEAATFVDQDGGDPQLPYIQPRLSRARLEVTWEPPEGVFPVGDGWISGDRVMQPCFAQVEVEYEHNGESSPATDYKMALRLYAIKRSDPSDDLQWQDMSPAETTVDPETSGAPTYNTARRLGGGDSYVGITSPWGTPGDSVGGGYTGCVVYENYVVPRGIGDLQLWCLDTDTGEKIWERKGFEQLPGFYAQLEEWRGDDPVDAEDMGDYPDFDVETYTVLGPGRPGHILVHIRTRHLYAKLAPDYGNGRVTWTVEGRPSGAPTVTISRNWMGKWACDDYDETGTVDPPSSEWLVDLFDGSGAFGGISGAPHKGQEFAPGSLDRPGRLENSTDVANQLAACLADGEELAGRLYWQGFYTPETTVRIEEISMATGETVSTMEGPAPVKTEQQNVSGVGLATQQTYDAEDVDGWPTHPLPNEELAEYGYVLKTTPDETPSGYIGGTFLTRQYGNVTLLRTYGPTEFEGFWENDNDAGSTMEGWAQFYTMRSTDSGDYAVIGGAPPGLYIPSNSHGEFDYATKWADQEINVFRCFSALAPGDLRYNKIPPPWPFDPSTLVTDGEVAIFLPRANSFDSLGGQNQHVGGVSEWPLQADECARCHKIQAFMIPTEVDGEWTLLWEIDAREQAGDAITLTNGNPHPCCGDVISNGVLQDGRLYCVARGSRGQMLWVIQARDLLTDPEDPESEVEIAAGTLLLELILTEDTSLRDGTGGVYFDDTELLCLCSSVEAYDTLMIHGHHIYGIGYARKRWKL